MQRVKFSCVHYISLMNPKPSERTLSHMWEASVRLYIEPENEFHTSHLQRCFHY